MNKKLQFSHITKTGGSSLEVGVKNQTMGRILWGEKNRDLWVNQIADKTGASKQEPWHTPLSKIEDENYLQNLLNYYDFFTIVRNPYERAISEYYCKFGQMGYFNMWKVKSKDVDVFNAHFNQGIKKILNKFRNKQDKFITHWQQQHPYVFKNNERIIEEGNVLRYEKYAESLEAFFIKKKFKVGKITQKLSTQVCHKHFKVDDLSEENIKILNEIYHKDFETFGYQLRE